MHTFGNRTPVGGLPLNASKAAVGLVPAAGTLVGGLVFCIGSTTGLYVLATAVITGFATATTTIARVRHVEIRR